ncbi:uncharacterized protein Gasu_64790 [Galdieria sulphuraria]|uniref:Uncharacterized protein n=1 Tax=Galdieria sulphuraria TaxID=130081 RepID=M2VRZ2_GALSU|nr:uncharacterized protein Gasu_64790 [Galdieria sulphuraria]EME25861.1 hypothetical protein Gasu_64790 [Galdieria sulphuraria]|eukprot:XP_005702381.1 hypothetical protein Gasu_64790 [Galdieria sulphuraria]
MAISKSTQSPLGWPLFSNFLTPFPHPFSPIAISPLFPISNWPILPPTQNGNFKSRSPLWLAQIGPFPHPFSPIAISPLSPISNLPILSHPTPIMPIFKSKLRGPIPNRPLFSNCPPFPLAEKISKKCVYWCSTYYAESDPMETSKSSFYSITI